MIIHHGTWYRLPDGTRVQAVPMPGDWIQLTTADGAPLYGIYAFGIRRLKFEPALGTLRTLPCDLTPDDLTPDPLMDLAEVDFDDEDRPICPRCQITMQLAQESVLFDVYRCASCGAALEV
jgi:hypothetical protein